MTNPRTPTHNSFRAKRIPPATLEHRYQAILAAQAAKREAGHEANLAQLTATERPFSFYQRYVERKGGALMMIRLLPHPQSTPSNHASNKPNKGTKS